MFDKKSVKNGENGYFLVIFGAKSNSGTKKIVTKMCMYDTATFLCNNRTVNGEKNVIYGPKTEKWAFLRLIFYF